MLKNKTQLSDAVLWHLVVDAAGETEVEEVFLFGSRARGDARPDSDYDLLLITRQQLSEESGFNLRARIRRAIRAYDVPADVLVLAKELRQEVLNWYGSVYQRALLEGRQIR